LNLGQGELFDCFIMRDNFDKYKITSVRAIDESKVTVLPFQIYRKFACGCDDGFSYSNVE